MLYRILKQLTLSNRGIQGPHPGTRSVRASGVWQLSVWVRIFAENDIVANVGLYTHAILSKALHHLSCYAGGDFAKSNLLGPQRGENAIHWRL